MHTKLEKLGLVAILAAGLMMPMQNVVSAAESLRIGTDGGAEPWTFTNSAGELIGFDIDVGNEVCARMEVECEWIITDWNGIFPALDLGKFDLIMAGVSVTPERMKSMDFTRSYAISLNSFAVKEGSSLAGYKSSVDVVNLDDLTAEAQVELDNLAKMLAGKVVGIQSGANTILFIEQYFKETDLREYEKLESRDLDIQAERLDLGMGGASYWKKVAGKEEVDIMAVGPQFGGGILGGEIGAPIKQGRPELKAKVDAALNTMVADGTLSKLAVKWLGSDASPKK